MTTATEERLQQLIDRANDFGVDRAQSLIRRLAAAGHGELVNSCLVVDKQWYVSDEYGDANATAFDSRAECIQALRECYDSEDATYWVEYHTFRVGIDAHANEVRVSEEIHNLTIEPVEPDCEDGEHDWQSPYDIVGGIKENPGVWSNGGGVIINEVCIKCGCGKTTDTWAQNPITGEQGLRSVAYEEGKYAGELGGDDDEI